MMFGLFKNKVEKPPKQCFFEKGRMCDRMCRAFSEKETCNIVDRLKAKADANECAELLRTLCRIDCDPKRIAEEFPDLVPPPKLVPED
jgi:hypothetical protein